MSTQTQAHHPHSSVRNSGESNFKNWLWLFLAIAASIPALVLRLMELTSGYHTSPEVAAIVFGLGIVGAAFLISWASEVAQMDMSQALALALLALVAVLPEYAVDMVFAWKAGAHPEGVMVDGNFFDYRGYAVANMTGGNRLLVGIGWPLIALLFWFRARKSLAVRKGVSLEILFLGAATAYSFVIFFRKEIALWDAAVLIGLFVAYMWLSSKSESEEPELVGPSAAIGSLPERQRRFVTYGLFAYSALVILASAEPFAEGLVEMGKSLNIDEFVLVQWVAPLASESPEILIATIFTTRGHGAAAMMALISSKINQWTLLVGCIPVVYSISYGSPSALHFDTRQTEEFLLTAAQSLFAVTLLMRLRIGWLGAVVLFALFSSQLFMPSVHARYIFSFVYLGLTALLFTVDRQRIFIVKQMVLDAAALARGKT